jgi:diguanylate cyclase (GGDEF)-like protein/PAS domain S-box-containing protein
MKTRSRKLGKKIRLPVSLGTRMGVTLSLVITLVVMTLGLIIMLGAVTQQGQSYRDLTRSLYSIAKPAVRQALQNNDIPSVQSYLGYLSLNPNLSGIEAQIDDRILFNYRGKTVKPNWLVRTLIPEALSVSGSTQTFPISGHQQATLKFVFSPAHLNQSVVNIFTQTLIIGTATLIALLALMMLILEHYTAPLKPLTRIAERLSRGEWNDDIKPSVASSREIREINDALSHSSATIRHYVQSLENTRIDLGQSENRLRSLINGMREILFEVDRKGLITFLNPAWQSVTGFQIEESLGKPFTDYLVEQSDKELFSRDRLSELEQKNREIRLRTANGDSTVWVTMEASAQSDKDGRFTGIVGTLGDITESVELNHMLNEYQQELYQLSVTDPLTSLYNRRHFDTQFDIILKDHLKNRIPLCLMLIDIDGFKFINDTYGHPVGDKVLRSVGDLLSNQLERGDYLARIGGDEFAIVMTNMSIHDVADKAHSLHKKINDIRVALPVGQMRIQCSIGVSGAPPHGSEIQDLIKAADVALYQAKRAGRNRVRILSPDTDQATMTIFNKGFQLRDALENGDINPVFQPICDIETGQPVAYEVLARMMHNDTIIPAKDFITIAEELGLTREVDLHIIEKALQLAPRNQTLFLNVGLSSFNDRPFVLRLQRLLQRARDEGQPVTIEITERDIVPLSNELLEDINSLREIGCKLALDDFGSGYSTYHFLNFFKPDFIKIEGTFVQGMIHSESDRRIVEHIHELASSFGMQTIAENIENEETLIALQSIGINSGQGMYFGSPQFLN